MEQSINPHAYCRLRFDEAAEEAIENLANVLQWHRNSPFEGLFVAQKDARAGAFDVVVVVVVFLTIVFDSFLSLSLSLAFACTFEVERTSFTRAACVFVVLVSPRKKALVFFSTMKFFFFFFFFECFVSKRRESVGFQLDLLSLRICSFLRLCNDENEKRTSRGGKGEHA